MGNETIPTRLQDPGGQLVADLAEPEERYSATLELEHRGRCKRVRVRLDPAPDTASAHHRRPDRRVMRLRTQLGRSTNVLVASDIPWTTIHFYAMRLLENEADREAWG